jgi:hypothetical protein
MASTYCIDCEREVGDNWPECYWCGGKKFKAGGQESSSVSSIPEENKSIQDILSEENLLPDPEDINFEDVEVSVERVRQLLSKDNLTESELVEFYAGVDIHYDELSEEDKAKEKKIVNENLYISSEKIVANTITGVFYFVILVLAVILFTKFGF